MLRLRFFGAWPCRLLSAIGHSPRGEEKCDISPAPPLTRTTWSWGVGRPLPPPLPRLGLGRTDRGRYFISPPHHHHPQLNLFRLRERDGESRNASLLMKFEIGHFSGQSYHTHHTQFSPRVGTIDMDMIIYVYDRCACDFLLLRGG